MPTATDSMGPMSVPEEALWGASTQRAVLNFPISGHRMPPGFVSCLARIKAAAALANSELGRIDPKKAAAIRAAALEIAESAPADQFPVDVFQTGSATSTNMNMNEVISTGAAVLLGEDVHPNDDVNLGQSSNDVIPTAFHVSVAVALRDRLGPALAELAQELDSKARAFEGIVKVGRTHLMDAIPITLGQEFSGYATQVRKAAARVERGVLLLCELAIGGTAVGTGLNTVPGFSRRVCAILNEELGIPFCEARNHFEAQAARDDAAEVGGQLAAVCAALTKIANDIRLLSSGPRAGFGELVLPATQPGSSIMPGKVNPVMPEMVVQVGLYVHGLVQTINACCRDGQLELNATLPLLTYCMHEAIECTRNAALVFARSCIHGLEANRQRCKELAHSSLMLVTALTPEIGYDAGARVAKKAHETGKSLKAVALEMGLLDEKRLDALLDPAGMLKPRIG